MTINYCTCCLKDDNGFHVEHDGELYCEECYAELLAELAEMEQAESEERAVTTAA